MLTRPLLYLAESLLDQGMFSQEMAKTEIIEKIRPKLKIRLLDNKDVSILKIRDTLFIVGEIINEDLENKIYAATVYGGFLDQNMAIVVVALEQKNIFIYAYAKEGLINQNTAEDAIDKVVKSLNLC